MEQFSSVYREQHKVLLIVLAHTVVHPGTVVVHLPDTSLTHRAVVSSLWLNTATAGTLEDQLTLS